MPAGVLGPVILTQEQLASRVLQLGQQLSRDYQGHDLVAVGVLKGAIIFLADLLRVIELPLRLDFIATASYGGGVASSGAVRILKDLETDIYGKDVLLVEDIVDSGLTLRYLLNNLAARGPASLKTCTLLDKPGRRLVEVPVDYRGFEVANVFVVGYGLDYAEDYRHLPYIAELKQMEDQ